MKIAIAALGALLVIGGGTIFALTTLDSDDGDDNGFTFSEEEAEAGADADADGFDFSEDEVADESDEEGFDFTDEESEESDDTAPPDEDGNDSSASPDDADHGEVPIERVEGEWIYRLGELEQTGPDCHPAGPLSEEERTETVSIDVSDDGGTLTLTSLERPDGLSFDLSLEANSPLGSSWVWEEVHPELYVEVRLGVDYETSPDVTMSGVITSEIVSEHETCFSTQDFDISR